MEGILTPSVKSLQAKSTNALSAFRKVVSDLTAANKAANKLGAEKSVKSAKLQDEIQDLGQLTQDNEKVIDNINKILS